MHAKPEVLQAEFTEALTRDRERIEVVLVQVSPEFAAAFLVFSPNETGRQKKERSDDRGNDVDADLALQRIDHDAQFQLEDRHHHKFPAAFERVMFSTATSLGLDNA